MIWTATHRDLYRYGGLPAAAWAPDARAVASVIVGAPGIFEAPGHGFVGGEPVRFTARPGNAPPSGIVIGTWYTVAAPANPDDPDFFSLLFAGVPVAISDMGSGLFNVIENVVPKIDFEMAAKTSYLVANAKAYQGPWTPPPPLWAPETVAHLAAPVLADILRVSTQRYDIAAVRARAVTAEAFVAHLREGEPMDDGTPPFDATSTPDNSAFAGRDRHPTHWRTGAL